MTDHDPQHPRDARRQRRIAEDWRPDPRMEEMARLRASDPDKYTRTFGPAGDVLLGLYENGKAAAHHVATHPEEEVPHAIFD